MDKYSDEIKNYINSLLDELGLPHVVVKFLEVRPRFNVYSEFFNTIPVIFENLIVENLGGSINRENGNFLIPMVITYEDKKSFSTSSTILFDIIGKFEGEQLILTNH